MNSTASQRPNWAWPVLLVAVLAVSTGALFARLADDAHPLAIAAWRCGLAALVLIVWSRGRSFRAYFKVSPEVQQRLVLAGCLLAIHFGTWILSLSYTSVTSSLVLVTTTPAWTALLAPILIGERTTARQWQGIALCAAGIAVLAFWQAPVTPSADLLPSFVGYESPTRGNVLAILGAISFSLFLINGRSVLREVSTMTYLTASYGFAAVALVICCVICAIPLGGYSPATYGWLIALALVPQLIGHSGYNLSLRYFSAATVAITLVGEPVIGSLLAWMYLAETPGRNEWLGGAFLLAGIVRAVRRPAS